MITAREKGLERLGGAVVGRAGLHDDEALTVLIPGIRVERNGTLIHVDEVKLLNICKGKWEPNRTAIDHIQLLQVLAVANSFGNLDQAVTRDIEELEAFQISDSGGVAVPAYCRQGRAVLRW